MHIKAFDISEAWIRAVVTCWKHGYDYTIEQGSFVGHTRRQLPLLVLEISNPNNRPFAPILPEGLASPFDEDTILTYAEQYILSPEVQPNEEYTYGNRIHDGIPKVIKLLQNTPYTNQAVIEVARPGDTIDVDRVDCADYDAACDGLVDPPCLRLLDWKVYDNKLNLNVYFRSWDIYAALATNLGGIQILNEFIGDETGIELGKLTALSSGAHIYDYSFELASALADYYEII